MRGVAGWPFNWGLLEHRVAAPPCIASDSEHYTLRQPAAAHPPGLSPRTRCRRPCPPATPCAAPQVKPRVVYWPTFFSDFSADIDPEMSANIVSSLVDVSPPARLVPARLSSAGGWPALPPRLQRCACQHGCPGCPGRCSSKGQRGCPAGAAHRPPARSASPCPLRGPARPHLAPGPARPHNPPLPPAPASVDWRHRPSGLRDR